MNLSLRGGRESKHALRGKNVWWKVIAIIVSLIIIVGGLVYECSGAYNRGGAKDIADAREVLDDLRASDREGEDVLDRSTGFVEELFDDNRELTEYSDRLGEYGRQLEQRSGELESGLSSLKSQTGADYDRARYITDELSIASDAVREARGISVKLGSLYQETGNGEADLPNS